MTSDYQTAVTSINLGQPLVQAEPSSKIAVEIKRIVAAILGQSVQTTTGEPQRKKIWSGLFKRGGTAQPNVDLRATLEKV